MRENKGISGTNAVVACAVLLATAGAIVAIVMVERSGGPGKRKGQDANSPLVSGPIDPNLVLFEEAKEPIVTGMNSPTGIAVGHDDRIYVVGDGGLSIFGASGMPFTVQSLPGPGQPTCVSAGADGTVFIGMKDHVEVYYPSSRQFAAPWPSLGTVAAITSICAAGDEVLVADAGNKTVYRCDRSGKFDKERNITGLTLPSPHLEVAVGPDGLVWVSNPGEGRLECRDREGKVVRAWGSLSIDKPEGFAGCCNPVHFAILSGGEFVTSEKGLVRVKLYSASGSFVGAVAWTDKLPQGGLAPALAVDSRGKVYVLDSIAKTIRVFVRKAE